MTKTSDRPGRAEDCGRADGGPEELPGLTLGDVLNVALVVRSRAVRESEEGRAAFAAMVLNCRAARKGGSACPAARGESGAPCPTANWLGLSEAAARADFEEPGFSAALRAVIRVASGAVGDPSRGATRFHAHDRWPGWARAAQPTALIGRHFYYRDGRRDGDPGHGISNGRTVRPDKRGDDPCS